MPCKKSPASSQSPLYPRSHLLTIPSRLQRASKFAEEGGEGQKVRVELELKGLADVGLIGFPNAGKSSLLASISKTRPKIASYPFTTLRPYHGDVEIGFHDSFTVADIPGLIKGAHDNIGLGHTFCETLRRHIPEFGRHSCTNLSLHLTDCAPTPLLCHDSLTPARPISAIRLNWSTNLCHKNLCSAKHSHP
jgi:Obg family GTPase CgtA